MLYGIAGCRLCRSRRTGLRFKRQTDGRLEQSGVAVDVSERSTNERARNEAETLYQNLVEQLSAVTYIAELGLESEWRFVSPQIQKLLGYSSAQWLY